VKFFVVAASPHPETVQGTAPDGSIVFDVAAPI
jgi:hypothetical protein